MIPESRTEPAPIAVEPEPLLSSPELALPSSLPRAALHMLGAAFLFAVMSVMVKLAAEWLPNAMIVFLRSSLSLLVMLPIAFRRGIAPLRTAHLREHMLRGLVGMAAMYCFFFAIAKLGLAEALLLNYSLPLFIPLVERVWLREPTPLGIWKPLGIGLAGLTLILKPGLALFQPAAVVGVMGALFAATAQVGVRGLTRTESITKIVFYFSIVSSLISVGPAIVFWSTPPSAAWPILIAMVGSATIAQFFMTRAYHLAPAAQVGPFIYGSVAFAGVFDWLLFAQHPDALSVAGTGLVVVAGVLALRIGRATPTRRT